MFHLYKKKPPRDNKEPPSNEPTIAPIKAGLFLSGCCILLAGIVGENVEVVICVVGDVDDVDDGDVGERSKLFVHIYSSLLLISSNKISLSVDLS